MPFLNFIIVICFMLTQYGLKAQISDGGTPISFQPGFIISPSSIPVHNMPEMDVTTMQQRALQLEKDCSCGKKYIASGEEVSFDVRNDGYLIPAPQANGNVWLYKVHSPNGSGVMIQFSNYHIPYGARLFIYNEAKTTILGAFTSQNNLNTGIFPTGMITGNTVYIEYFEPFNADFHGNITAAYAFQSYRQYEFGLPTGGGGVEDDGNLCGDERDADCFFPSSWNDQKKSIAYILSWNLTHTGVGGYFIDAFVCSGVMLNNTAGDGTPYLLSAQHCLGYQYDTTHIVYNDPRWWVVYFNIRKPCNASYAYPPYYSIAGGYGNPSQNHTMIDNQDMYYSSDFVLVKLSSKPKRSWNVCYSGWDRSWSPGTTRKATVMMGHSQASPLKAALDRSTVSTSKVIVNVRDTISRYPAYWKFHADSGRVDHGDSGGPLYDSAGRRVIGQTYGGDVGDSDCIKHINGNIYFGKFQWMWNNSSYVRAALDPVHSGGTGADSMTNSLCCETFIDSIAPQYDSFPYRSYTWSQRTSGTNYNGILDKLVVGGTNKLTISNTTIRMGDPGIIIVEPNAQLILNNVTFLKYNYSCPMGVAQNYWKGIIVGGKNPTDIQQTGSGNMLNGQGIVIANGCHFQDADSAINSYYGGIVQVKNSTFRNCRTSIWLRNYENGKGEEVAYSANRIQDNIFVWDSLKNGEPDFRDYSFIKLDDVHGLEIEGDSFYNANTTITDGTKRGIGINAQNSSFILHQSAKNGNYTIVPETGCPRWPSNAPINTFRDLSYGVAMNLNNSWPSAYSSTVINSGRFTNNLQAIYMNGGRQNTINKSYFYFYSSSARFSTSGLNFITMDNSPYFVIHGNTMQSNNNGGKFIVINNSLNDSSMIRLNKCLQLPGSYTNHNTGIYVTGNNMYLLITCNTIAGFDYGIDSYLGASLCDQGSSSKSAGNKWTYPYGSSPATALHNVYDLLVYKLSNAPINYYFTGSNPLETPNANSYNYHPQGGAPVNYCDSLGCQNWPLPLASIFSMKGTETISVNAFPNPANTEITLQITGAEHHSPYNIRITDINGKELKYIRMSPYSVSATIPIQQFAAGLYFYQIYNSDQYLHTGKFIIRH